jgi:hypothetical protein
MEPKSTISSIFLHAGKYLNLSPNQKSQIVPFLLTADTQQLLRLHPLCSFHLHSPYYENLCQELDITRKLLFFQRINLNLWMATNNFFTNMPFCGNILRSYG